MKKIILLVEDNPGDEALVLRAFKKSGITNDIVVTRDGAEALDYLFRAGPFADRQPEEMPALILMDLSLPKIGGLEALRRIRAEPATKLIPVVILTSSNEEEDRREGYEIGANSYAHKPVEFNKFAKVVQQLGSYWLILNEAVPPKNGTLLKHET
jgi:two-component system response regulator